MEAMKFQLYRLPLILGCPYLNVILRVFPKDLCEAILRNHNGQARWSFFRSLNPRDRGGAARTRFVTRLDYRHRTARVLKR